MQIRVKKVQLADPANRESNWEAIIDYGGHEIKLPLPARLVLLEGEDLKLQVLDSIEALERVGDALLQFAAEVRRSEGFPLRGDASGPDA